MSITVSCGTCKCRFALGEALFEDWLDAKRSLICPRCESYLRYARREESKNKDVIYWGKQFALGVLISLPVLGMARLFSHDFLPAFLLFMVVFLLVRLFFQQAPTVIYTEAIPNEELGEGLHHRVFENEAD